jgi:peptidoglycan hydrolase-like protein with peptidoglycan-binding domain
MATDVCTLTRARPTIKRGASGDGVKQAQCYLNSSLTGTPLVVDGSFGPITEKAVRRFQGCADITVDGLVGAQTWSQLTFWANSPDFVC